MLLYLSILGLLPSVTTAITIPPTLVLPITNLTAPIIHCHALSPQYPHTTIPTCRPTLNYLRSIPSYRLQQDFQQMRSPRIPIFGGAKPPPYTWHIRASDCAVTVESGQSIVVDRFSFENVRAAALEVLEFCEDRGGAGGWVNVGREVGWKVEVKGFKMAGDRGVER